MQKQQHKNKRKMREFRDEMNEYEETPEDEGSGEQTAMGRTHTENE